MNHAGVTLGIPFSNTLSMFDFIKSLGRAGTKMPNVVYPGKDPGGQYISFPGAL
jgi:hypothetical protein